MDDTTIQRTPGDMAQINKYLAYIQSELDKTKAQIDRPFEVKVVYTPAFVYLGQYVADSITIEFIHPIGKKLVVMVSVFGVIAPTEFELSMMERNPGRFSVDVVRGYVDQLYRNWYGGEG